MRISRTALGVYALAPILTYLLGSLRFLLIRAFQILSGYEPPNLPQLRSHSFDYYLFRFLDVAYPIGAMLAYLFGIRLLFKQLQQGARFSDIRVVWLLFVISGLSYLLPMLDPFYPSLPKPVSFFIAVGSLAALSRLKDQWQLNPKKPDQDDAYQRPC